MKWLFIGCGIFSLAGGLVTFWLPLPIGIPLMLVGLVLLMRHSHRANRWIQRHGHRVPVLHRALQRLAARPRQAGEETD